MRVMTDSRRVLVTGGAGFVGATLVRRLIASGHTVRVFDNLFTGHRDHLTGVDVELAQGHPGRRRAGQGAGGDGLGDTWRRLDLVQSVADPVTNFDVNVVGTFQVLDAARRRRGADRAGLHGGRTDRRRHTAGGRAVAAQADLPVWRERAGRRGLRVRIREGLRPAHAGAAVRQRVRPGAPASAGPSPRSSTGCTPASRW